MRDTPGRKPRITIDAISRNMDGVVALKVIRHKSLAACAAKELTVPE
ncbi:hypothetical protein AB0I10_32170 [Streptomyces sp. NPDC050636]